MKQNKTRKHVLRSMLFLHFFIISSFQSVLISQTFENVFRTNYDDLVIDALELDDGTFLATVSSGNFFNIERTGILLHISDEGAIIDSVIINAPDEYQLASITNLYKINDSCILVLGTCFIPDESNYYIMLTLINQDFNITEIVVTENFSQQSAFINYLINNENNLVVIGSDMSDESIFIYEYAINGELVKYKHYNDPSYPYPWAYSIIEFENSNLYHMHVTGPYPKVWKINSDSLSIDTVYHIYYALVPRVCVISDNPSIYFLAGEFNNIEHEIKTPSYLLLNDTGEILETHEYIAGFDTNSYFIANCFTYRFDKIYFAVTYNFTSVPPFVFIPENRWIWMNKLNLDGSIIWQRFYKGEVNYMPYKVLATSDGGALILSTKYDWNDSIPLQRDVHILKVDSTGWYDGLQTGTTEFDKPKQILVYPNPVKDDVKFVLGLYNNLELSIYNSNGQHVIQQKLLHSQTLNISNFPKGLYFYILTGEDGFFEKGKLIKL